MIPLLEHRRLRRWFGEILDNATNPFEIDLTHLTEVTYDQRGHAYVGNRPHWEVETWLGERTLSFRRGPYAPELTVWEVRQMINRWITPGDEHPYLLLATHEFFLSHDEAFGRYEDRYRFVARLLTTTQPFTREYP